MKSLHLFALLLAMGAAPVLADATTVEDLIGDEPATAGPETGALEPAAPEIEAPETGAPETEAIGAERREAPAGETEAFASSETGDGDAVTAPVAAELPQAEMASVNACTAEQSLQLRELGREYALSLVRNDFLGGQGVEHLVQDCTFDGAIYQGILHVRWRGALMGWNEYSLWGRLRTYPDGANATFAPRGASESVQALQFWGNVGTIGLSLVP